MKSFKLGFKCIATIVVLFTLVLVFSTTSDASGSFTRVNFGTRSYSIFVPSSYRSGQPVPLVVMIHGCTQDANDFMIGTQMNLLAERENFIVIYPEQSPVHNAANCWNFFETANQRRGSGEPQVIVDMVNHVRSNFTINSDAIFTAGISSGGALTTTLGVLYPDVFRAISVHAGLSYQSGINAATGLSAMFSAVPAIHPALAANNAVAQIGVGRARVVPTLVVHGSFDTVVNPLNGDHVVAQMLTYNAWSDPSINIFNRTFRTGTAPVANGRTYSVESFRNSAGQVVVEHHRINLMGHDWSGGNAAGSHTDPRGPNASEIVWRFFRDATRVRR